MEFYESYPLEPGIIDYSKYDEVDALYSLGKGRDLIERDYGRRVFFMDSVDMRLHRTLENQGVPVLPLEVVDDNLGRLIIPEGARRYDSLRHGAYSDASLKEVALPLGRALRKIYDTTRLVPRTSVLTSFLNWTEVNNEAVGVAVCPPYDLALEPNPHRVFGRIHKQVTHDMLGSKAAKPIINGIFEGWEYVG